MTNNVPGPTKTPRRQGSSVRALITFFSILLGIVVLYFAGNFLIDSMLFTFFESLFILTLPALFFLLILPILVWLSIILVPYNTIWLIERLGSRIKVKNAGVRMRIPFIDVIFSKEDLRFQENLIEANEALTKKGTTVNVTAVLFWQLLPDDPARFIQEVQNPSKYIQRIAEAAIRRLISAQSIEELQKIDEADTKDMNEFLYKEVGSWAKSKIEITDIQLPESIKNALAQVEKAEQEAKAEIIRAEAEIQVVEKLQQAVRVYLPESTPNDLVQAKAIELLRTLATLRKSEGVLALADIASLIDAKVPTSD